MNNAIKIVKNASCTFDIVIKKNFKELPSFIQSDTYPAKEIIYLIQESAVTKELKEELTNYGICLTTYKKENFREMLQDASDKEATVVWFASKDHESLCGSSLSSIKNLHYIIVPITPVAQITCENLYTINMDKNIEVFPSGIYLNIDIWKTSGEAFHEGVAAVLRKGIEENAIFYEWFISNMYEVFDKDENLLIELLEKNASLLQKRLDKLTVAQRCVPYFGSMFKNSIQNTCVGLNDADIISLSCIMHAYIGWGQKILSMEEFYEIRDMFVAFDMRISETDSTAKKLLKGLETPESVFYYGNFTDFPYLSKIGKVIYGIIPSRKELEDAANAIYFDEEAND